MIDPAVLQGSPQPHQFGRGLGHVDVDGIERLNGGQDRLIRRHNGPFGHVAHADAAGNRSGDLRVTQVDLGRLERGFGLLDRRLGRRHRRPVALHLRLGGLERGLGHVDSRDGLVTLAGGDSLLLEQVLQPLAVCPGERHGRLLPGDACDARTHAGPRPVGRLLRGMDIGRRAVMRRLEGGRVDLVEYVAGLNVGTFREEPFLYEAADLGPDLCDQVAGSPPRQLRGQDDPLRLDRHDRYFRGRSWRGGFLLAVTTRQKRAHQQRCCNRRFPYASIHELAPMSECHPPASRRCRGRQPVSEIRRHAREATCASLDTASTRSMSTLPSTIPQSSFATVTSAPAVRNTASTSGMWLRQAGATSRTKSLTVSSPQDTGATACPCGPLSGIPVSCRRVARAAEPRHYSNTYLNYAMDLSSIFVI